MLTVESGSDAMNYPCKPLALALALALVPAQSVTAAEMAVLSRLVSGSTLDVAQLQQLARHAVQEPAGLQAMYRQLGQLAGADHRDSERALALLARAHVYWAQGEAAAAMADVDQALTLAVSVDALWLQARLREADGETEAAAAAYRRLLTLDTASAQAQAASLRLALLEMHDSPGALPQWANHHPAASEGVALVLGLQGQPAAALALSQTHGLAVASSRQRLQAATWALAAGQQALAREHAWAAFTASDDHADRRYALALLMEAYRDQDQLPQALDFLAAHAADVEVQQARVDALLELQRYDQAIALVQATRDAALRQRLPGILELAGRRDALIAEYRRLIEQQPHAAAAYDSLAGLYLGEDSPQLALEVYRQLFARNPGRAEVLLPAARQMQSMGLQAQALELLEAQAQHPSMLMAVARFRFDAYLSQGQESQAEQVLQGLQQRLAGDDLRRIELADGYERLQQPQQALTLLLALEHQRRQALDDDLQMRIADLENHNGQPEQALARLQRLWQRTPLPARRGVLERKIVRIARDAGKLDALASQLDAPSDIGTKADGDIGLLLALRLAQQDRQGAEAAIVRHGGSAESVAQLTRLSDLYARLGDDDKLQASLRRLLEVDRRNADLYLRKLALLSLRQPAVSASGVMETPPQRLQRVEQLIAQLRQAQAQAGHDDAEVSRFAAGLYVMAGYGERALAAYRQAVAAAPQDIDSVLQLAEQLQQQQQLPQAVALLQYAAEHATEQRHFALLIDGLIGLFAREPSVPRDDGAQAALAVPVLQWAQRQVMQRIIGSDEVYPLFSLLADLALAQADFELCVRAYEHSLAMAGEQRPLVLRQMVTLSSGTGGDETGSAPRLGDARRKLRFGRRLIALKPEFPPAFYADLGRTLLAGGDAAGAERTFALMSDIGGLVNLAQIKGEAYAAEGYATPALLNYGQALAREQGNLPLLLKTSILREQIGQPALANHWYWNGLRSLILRQPLRDDGMLNEAELDTRRHAPALVEGLLLTWPQDAASAQQILSALQQLFEATIAQVDPTPAATLARYPRLSAIVDLQWQIARVHRDDAAADAIHARLAQLFGNDVHWQRDAAYQRRMSSAVAVSGSTLQPALQALLAQASQPGSAGNQLLALTLASNNGDQAAIAGLVQQAMQAEQQWQARNSAQDERDPGPDTLYQLLLQAMQRLPADSFRNLVYAPLQAAPFRDKVLFNLYRGAPERYAELTRILGAAPMSEQTLIRMLVAHGNDPLPLRTARRSSRASAPDQLIGNFTIANQISLYAQLVDHMLHTGVVSMLQQQLLQQLLRQPLSSTQQAMIAEIAGKELAWLRRDPSRTLAGIVPNLLIFDPLPANQPLLLQILQRAVVLYPDAQPLPGILQRYFAGDRDQAFAQLQAFLSDVRVLSTTLQIRLRQFFPEQRQRRIAGFLGDTAVDAAQAAAFHREIVLPAANGIEPLPEAVLRDCYEKLLGLQPDNVDYLAGLLKLQLQAADLPAFSENLRAYVQRNPRQHDAVVLLALAYRLQNQPVLARQLMQDASVDLDDVGMMVAMIDRANAAQHNAAAANLGQLYLQVYAQYAAHNPDLPVVQAVQERQRAAQASQEAPGEDLHVLAQAMVSHPQQVAGVLRGLWRNGDAMARQQLFNVRFDLQGHELGAMSASCAGAAVQPDLLRELAAQAAVSAEYEHYLRAMAAEERAHWQRLYELLAQGLIVQGKAEQRSAQLLQQLAASQADGHELQLLATLVVQRGVALPSAQRVALQNAVQALPTVSAEQRELLASVAALGGDYQAARQLLEAALLQWLYPDDAGSRGYQPGRDPAMAIVHLLASLRQWPDRELAGRSDAALRRFIVEQGRGSSIRVPEPMPAADGDQDRCASAGVLGRR
jgi:hypothetical protein